MGGAVSLDLASPAGPHPQASPAGLLVLSWNVWIGRGRLLEVIQRLRDGDLGVPADLPPVLLIQEAYRRDASIPERSNGFAPRELVTRVRQRQDIVEVASSLGWNLRYIPSMRNGPDRTDRGNAILSPLALGPAAATELPFVLQRRVAVAATVSVGGRPVRLVSLHLDPRGPVGYKWLGAAGRGLQMTRFLENLEDPTVVLGADLNLGRGRAERAWRLLGEAGFQTGVPATPPAWRHTYHSLPRLVIDYILLRDRAGVIRSARVRRVDEDPRDRGPTVFGSDHHPLLARLEVAT